MYIRLTSPVGDFIFTPKTPISHAKLVRDTIQGQMLNPKPGVPHLKSASSMRSMIADEFGKSLGDIKFIFRAKVAA